MQRTPVSSALAATVLLLGLFGCSSADNGQPPATTPPAEAAVAPAQDQVQASREAEASAKAEASRQAEASKAAAAEQKAQAARDAVIAPKHTIKATVTDHDGNRQRVTFQLTDWIMGSDLQSLEEAWLKAGGDAPMPLTAGQYTDGGGSTYDFSGKYAVYTIGTATVENATPDFDASSYMFGHPSYSLEFMIEEDGKPRWVSMGDSSLKWFTACRQYSSETKCGTAIPLIQPKMNSNRWGPVPVVLGVDSAFTPKHPDGVPELNRLWLGMRLGPPAVDEITGDTAVPLKKTW